VAGGLESLALHRFRSRGRRPCARLHSALPARQIIFCYAPGPGVSYPRTLFQDPKPDLRLWQPCGFRNHSDSSASLFVVLARPCGRAAKLLCSKRNSARAIASIVGKRGSKLADLSSPIHRMEFRLSKARFSKPAPAMENSHYGESSSNLSVLRPARK